MCKGGFYTGKTAFSSRLTLQKIIKPADRQAFQLLTILSQRLHRTYVLNQWKDYIDVIMLRKAQGHYLKSFLIDWEAK